MSEIRIGRFIVAPHQQSTFRVWEDRGPIRVALAEFEDEAAALRYAHGANDRGPLLCALSEVDQLVSLIESCAPHLVIAEKARSLQSLLRLAWNRHA